MNFYEFPIENRKLKSFLLLFFFAEIIGCDNSKNTNERVAIVQVKNAEWILGTWENKTDDGVSIEFWEKENDSTFSGHSYLLNNGDTLFSEKLQLKVIDDTLYYIPIVKDQNSAQPVFFKLKSAKEDQLVFENKKHNFPQLITYSKITGDSILAEISGLLDGRESMRQFPMSRKK